MTAPIPISSASSGRPVDSPPNSNQGHGHHPSASTSSTLSSSPSHSPQTPFSPSFNISSPPSQPNSSILKWASTSFGSLGSPPINVPQNPLDHDHDHEHHQELHDAFEFGDHGDMNRGSWTGHTRRAASMSNASGIPAAGGFGSSPTKTAGGGGISAMLSGFGGSAGSVPNNAIGVPVGSPPSVGGGVLAGNVAKGQGLLRRLSLGGAGRGRPQMSPTISTQPLAPNQPSVPIPTPAQSDSGMLLPEGGPAQRGRRYSENPGAAGKKRGVSPMGERILRDHGHF